VKVFHSSTKCRRIVAQTEGHRAKEIALKITAFETLNRLPQRRNSMLGNTNKGELALRSPDEDIITW